MASIVLAKLVKKDIIRSDIFKFSVHAPEIVNTTKPGQFIEIQVSDEVEPFLRRPISVYNVDKENGILEFIFEVRGIGTKILAKKEEGDNIDILGPLGWGSFNYEGYKNIAVLGGGIGIFPLYELCKNAKNDANVHTYLGFRDERAVMLEKEFKQVSSSLTITLDNVDGFAINKLRDDLEAKNIDIIFACGPLGMLKAVQELAKEKNISCQISLEEKMGCGFGVCMGCAVKMVNSSYYKHVCKEGPVFEASEVEI
ncbi:MAG: dihydroorotate dehydrogenase electron transfer subunit [Oscillospiraceae bacterium]|nr:dihydroorotate dehydrogenase electron transfer subunit [Oscillospiraceae bacterium]